MKQIAIDYEGKLIPFSGDAYVNLTAMCEAFGKSPHHFLQLESTRSYITALAAETGLPKDPSAKLAEMPRVSETLASLLVTIEGRSGGTWAHPDLAIECARWCYPPFGIWCNRTIRKLLSGELIHPAMDKEDLKEREARIAGLNNKAAVEKDRYWKALEVEGNVSLRAYYKCVGLNPPVHRRMVIGRSLGNRAVAYGYPVGKVRQRRGRTGDLHSDCSGWQTVATYPPREIHAELIRQGLLPKGTAVPPWDLLTAEMGRLTSRLYGALPELSAVEAPMDHLNAPTLGNRTTTITLNQPELAL